MKIVISFEIITVVKVDNKNYLMFIGMWWFWTSFLLEYSLFILVTVIIRDAFSLVFIAVWNFVAIIA